MDVKSRRKALRDFYISVCGALSSPGNQTTKPTNKKPLLRRQSSASSSGSTEIQRQSSISSDKSTDQKSDTEENGKYVNLVEEKCYNSSCCVLNINEQRTLVQYSSPEFVQLSIVW